MGSLWAGNQWDGQTLSIDKIGNGFIAHVCERWAKTCLCGPLAAKTSVVSEDKDGERYTSFVVSMLDCFQCTSKNCHSLAAALSYWICDFLHVSPAIYKRKKSKFPFHDFGFNNSCLQYSLLLCRNGLRLVTNSFVLSFFFPPIRDWCSTLPPETRSSTSTIF